MTVAQQIEDKLKSALSPERLSLVNESHQHNVAKGSETHFNLIIVSPAFEGKNRVQRQRAVYGALGEELKAGVHALTMKTLTPAEWDAAGGEVVNPAPRCMGGSKHDKK
jgi:BolA protein